MRKTSRTEPGIVLRHANTPSDLSGICSSIFERQDAVHLGPSIDFPGVSPLLHFVLGDECDVRNYGQDMPFERAPRAAIWGSQTCVHEMRFGGPMFVTSAVLTLDGAARLTGQPVSALVDTRVTLDDLGFDSAGICSRLKDAQTFKDRADVLIAWLREATATRRHHTSHSLEFEVLASGQLSGSISSIAAELGVTTRGLHKRAMRDVGLSPKTILRYARLQAALRYCHPNPSNPVDTEELLMQFYDRSHFSAEFQRLTGLTPREYRLAKQRTGDRLLNMVYLDATPAPETHI